MKWVRIHGDGQCFTDELSLPTGGRLIRVTMTGRHGGCGLAYVGPDDDAIAVPIEEADAKAEPEQRDTAAEPSMTSGLANPYVPEAGSPYATGGAAEPLTSAEDSDCDAEELQRADEERAADPEAVPGGDLVEDYGYTGPTGGASETKDA